MRRLGYLAVDLLVDRQAGLAAQPVLRRDTPAELDRRLSGPPPEGPQPFEGILEQLGTDVLPFISITDHPAYFAYVPGSGTWPGVLGDLIASACNIEQSSWVQAAGPSTVELADSVTLDPHKWLYQPFECGCLLVREGPRLGAAFRIQPDYLKDTESGGLEVNFSDLGLQLSRASRALKVWISLRYFGVDAFRRAIDRSLDLAQRAQARIEASPRLELLSPARLGVVCFRRQVEGADEDGLERLNRGLVEGLAASGVGLISSTRLQGRYALRMCVLNHGSGTREVERVLDWLEQAPAPAAVPEAPGALPSADRGPQVVRRLEGAPSLAALRQLPLFQSLADPELERIVGLSGEQAVATGDTIVEQWAATREFYIVLEGTAAVRTAERQRDSIGPGDFFGELAALDWGAGFGYPRLATVTATSPMRLLVLPSPYLLTLMQEIPSLGAAIQRAVRDRLPGL